jgi:hypothetical protein
MKNAFIFGSGMAVGAAGLAVFTVGAIGLGLVAIAIESGVARQEAREDLTVNNEQEI